MRLRSIIVITTTLGLSLCRGQGLISTVAGTGTCCADADGVAATLAYLQGPDGLTIDSAGNLYIWEVQPFRVRKVNTDGIITTVAGVYQSFGGTGDGGPATSALLFGGSTHSGLAMDSAGNLYISDGNNHRIRKVNTSGIISTVAGNGAPGFSGDNGPATSAMLNYPEGIAVDGEGNLYIADSSNLRIRKVSAAGIITTVAGNGNVVTAGDGGPATGASFGQPIGVTLDSAGNLYLCDGRRVRKVNTAGIISTVAGTGVLGNSGDGGPATSAQLRGASGMAVDRAGNLYIADISNQRIRKVDAAGIISTIAGSTLGFSGDGGPSTAAKLTTPHDVVFDAMGNLYVSDTGNHRIRKIAAGGAAISATPGTISFSYTIGGAAPVTQTMSVSSPGADVSFSVTASTSSGSWLSVSPGTGTTPATLSVSVSPTGLPGGVYQGAITITPAGASAQTFSVSLTVSGAGAPVFSAGSIVNATGYQTKLAPDTVFTIFGSGMGPESLAAANGPNYPASLGGTSITFTPAAGGAAITAKMVYSVSGQVAGLLPSSITPGTYAVRVTYNTLTSTPQNVTVVARSFGIATANSAGSGTAQATIGNVNGGVSLVRFTSGSLAFNGLDWTLTPAHPGDTLVLWGTGGGADAANDTGGTSGDQTQAGNFSVTVGGRRITPLYAGASSGYPGLWQINFTLPADITPGCFVTAQAGAGGELSNTVLIPIAADGQSACSDPLLSQASLAVLDAGGTIKGGGFGVAKSTNTFYNIASPGGPTTSITATQEAIGGGMFRYTATEFTANFGLPRIGACTISDYTTPNGTPPGTPDGFLDLGAGIPVAGPKLASGAMLGRVTGIYTLPLANGTIANGGKYTLAGTGGTDVGAFNASVSFPSSFVVTNFDSIGTIDRTKPLAINWTGGDDQVYILISSSRVVAKGASNTNIIHNVVITCQVPAAPGTFSVPAAALAYLVPEGIDAASRATGSGIFAVGAVNNTPFTAPLVGGGQTAFAGFSGSIGVSKNLVIQ